MKITKTQYMEVVQLVSDKFAQYAGTNYDYFTDHFDHIKVLVQLLDDLEVRE